MNRYAVINWILKIVIAIILFNASYLKLSSAPGAVYIFSTIGAEPWGRIATGIMELIAALLILLPATTVFGAILAIGLMAGAIFFHLTKLGISVQNDGGQLFMYAISVAVLSLVLLYMHRKELLRIVRGNKPVAK